MADRISIRSPENNHLFWIFKIDDKYYRIGLWGTEKVSPSFLGYTKKQLDKLWVVGLPIVDLNLV